jgi:flagellar hook-length control protein FliK
MPTTLQTPAASAPQSTQSTPATLQAAPQTPTSVTPNLNLFALNIAARAQGGLKQFDITMDPADLGRVNVSLSIDSAGKTQAHLSADRPQTLALLQQDSSSLRIALRNVGLNVAQNGLNFSLNGQNPGQHNAKSTPGGRGRALSIRAVAAVGAAQSVLPVFSSTGVNTRLDIHV